MRIVGIRSRTSARALASLVCARSGMLGSGRVLWLGKGEEDKGRKGGGRWYGEGEGGNRRRRRETDDERRGLNRRSGGEE